MAESFSTPNAEAAPNAFDDPGSRKRRRAVGLLLGLLIGGVYNSTLHPGVGRGDSAELQYAAAVLGVCHPPGYAIETSVGHVFCRLPFGADPARRMNVLMMLSGTAGCLALYGATARITKQMLPGVTSATLLAFSSLYWTHSVLAEVYVFYGAVLALCIYACVRAAESGGNGWLYAASLLFGVCVGERISEALLAPAFALLLLGYRRRFRWSAAKVLGMAGLFLLPFLLSVSYFLWRDDPGQIYARDDAAAAGILGERRPDNSPSGRVKQALLHCSGFQWAESVEVSGARMLEDLDKLGWHLSGLGAFGDRYDIDDVATYAKQANQGDGSSLGILGCLLAVGGILFWRERIWWTTFAAALFLGNMSFYFLHQPPDNLDFTIPGLIGLAMLAGFGVAGGGLGGVKSRRAARIICLAAPLFLLTTNYHRMNRNVAAEHERAAYCARLATAPLPPDSVVIAQRNSGMVYRYLFHAASDRRDVTVINAPFEHWGRLMDYYAQHGRPAFFHSTPENRPPIGRAVVPGDKLAWEFRRECLRNTPRELAELNFLRAPAGPR